MRRSSGGLRFRGLGDAGEIEVLLHGDAGLGGVMRANGAIDLAMHLRGFLEINCVDDGFAAVLIEIGGDGLHEGAEDWIAGGASDGAVESHIVNKVLVRIGKRGIHFSHFFSKLRNMLVGRTLRSQRSDVGFKDKPRLKHLPRKKSMERAKNGK